MKEKNKQHTRRFLLVLAIMSFLIAAFEGTLYYSEKPAFFRILLVLQNSINAFAFKPSISLTDAITLMDNHRTPLYIAIGYSYGAAVFTAPYCTLAVVYKVLERLMRVMFGLRHGKRDEHIAVFGYNDSVRAMLRNYDQSAHKKRCIHIISEYAFTSEERYELISKGCRLHQMAVLRADEKELHFLMEKAMLDRADHVILFEDSSVTNFSLLQIFSLTEGDGRFALKSGTRITCRCEDDSIGELIADYYRTSADGKTGYSLEIVSIPELQVRKMFCEKPLHSTFLHTDLPVSQWHTHLLILGFGQIGQQTLLQAINLGVFHSQNEIVIDIYDQDIANRMEIFANRFAMQTFEKDGLTICLRPEAADGRLLIRGHKLNVRFQEFFEEIRVCHREMPFTYAVAAIDDISVGVHCVMQLAALFTECGTPHIPILMRMDSDRRLAKYINNNDSTLADVFLIEDRAIVLSLDLILNREINSMARQFHHLYSGIQVVSKNEMGWDTDIADAEELWSSTSLFRRESSKALAAHSSVKQVIFERLAKELGLSDVDAAIDALIGTDGSLMTYDGKIWHLREDEDGFLAALAKSPFADAAARMEHRRWCYFVASSGWRYGVRDDARKIHNCLLTFDALCQDENGRTTVKYDLMALMQRYLAHEKAEA